MPPSLDIRVNLSRAGFASEMERLSVTAPWQAPAQGAPLPTLLPIVFARQLLEQPVCGALDIIVVFGTGALFGSDQGATM
jgi:hypothetical protein